MSDKKEIAETLSGCTEKIFYDEPMSQHTSLKVGGNAAALIIVENEDRLIQIIRRLHEAAITYLPVGNLTNVIVRDGGYRGVILLMNGLNKIEYQQIPGSGHFIYAEAGAALARVVGISDENGLTGLEFCAGIPGSVGGAVWMNAGAFGREMKDVVAEVSLLNDCGRKITLPKDEIFFCYRRTVLPEKAIILNARLKVEKGERGQIKEKIREIIELRRKKHPLAYPSAGSVFKNLPGLPAGRLIEEIGLKGKSIGDAEVSPQHANFIVNKGKATASDILTLIDFIQNKAREEKGVNLETEVVIIGEDQCRRN